jgi:DNA-binding transcriptional MerR regulator
MAGEPKLGSKIFYKIGEVSELTKLPAYVLRFWESQFGFLKPRKSGGHQRLYVRTDIEKLLEIKRMLYEEGYTIAGVKRIWSRRGRQGTKTVTSREVAQRVRGELKAALRILASYDGR